MSTDVLHADDFLKVNMGASAGIDDILQLVGHYSIECHDSEGNQLWSDEFDNLVTTVGMNAMLVSGVIAQGTSFMGLIGSVSGGGPAVGDTMASHAGWAEGGTTNIPTYANRATVTYTNPPTTGVLNTSSTNTFVMTSSGTVQGGFIVLGTGSSATNLNTGGVLLSAGELGTPQPVISTNTITMSYSLTL